MTGSATACASSSSSCGQAGHGSLRTLDPPVIASCPMLCLRPLTSVRRRAYVCPVLSGKFPYYTVEPPTTSIRQTPGTPSLLRAINERTVLELIRAEGALSRAQVARRSGLSKPTVSQALTGLEESG